MSKLTQITVPRFLLGILLAALSLCASVELRAGERCRQEEARLLTPAGPGPAAVVLDPTGDLEETTPLVEAAGSGASLLAVACAGRRLILSPGAEIEGSRHPDDDPTLPRPPPT